MQARTQFPPEPRSAADARHWVRHHLNEIGRTDLVDAAELGVSELVTNGILHAQTSIGLQLTRHHERVVIEVYDGSPMVQQPAVDAGHHPGMDSTIGRGLRIVRAHAREWGVSTTTHGKSIWFQPAPAGGTAPAQPDQHEPAPHADVDSDGDVVHPPLDLDAALDALAEAFPEPEGEFAVPGRGDASAADGAEDTVQVSLLGVPPWVVQHYRKRWLELLREMQLLALDEPSARQQLAQRFCSAAHEVNAELYVIERSKGDFTPPASDDGATVDAVFEVRRSTRSAYVRIRDMARELEREWAGSALLFVHPGPQAVQLREWWLGELIGQIDGAAPTPWRGEMRVHDDAMLSGSANGSGGDA